MHEWKGFTPPPECMPNTRNFYTLQPYWSQKFPNYTGKLILSGTIVFFLLSKAIISYIFKLQKKLSGTYWY